MRAGGGMVDQVLRFEVDDGPGVALGFCDRLARENGWSRPFAGRVYDEYRRFLVLAVTGDGPVTPSDEVDQAWHLHLTYTRSYWDDLCGTVLGRPLHHGPTGGTPADGALYREQYAATLGRYREVFGHEPPPDIWPSVAERFREPERWQRVDTRAHLVLRRAPVVAAATGAVLAATLTAATARTDDGVALGALVVVAVVVVGFVGLALWLAGRRPPRGRRRASDGGGGAIFVFGDGGDSGHHDGGGCRGGGDSGHDGGGGGEGGGCGGGGCGGGGCGGGG